MEAVLLALADQSRRTMLETLILGPATAGELAALLPIARPGVSRHLRVLREAGLVRSREKHSGVSTVFARSRWLRSTDGWINIGPCGNSGSMPCTPR